MSGPASEITKSGLWQAHSSMRMQASTPPAAAPPNGAGMSPLEESCGDRLFERWTCQQGSPERVGLLADLGGERTQVLFGELTGTELQLLLLRAEMKRDGHGGSHRSCRPRGVHNDECPEPATGELAPCGGSAMRHVAARRVRRAATSDPRTGGGLTASRPARRQTPEP